MGDKSRLHTIPEGARERKGCEKGVKKAESGIRRGRKGESEEEGGVRERRRR